MKKLLIVFTLMVFCIVPAAVFAANDATDKGSVVLDFGTVLGISFYSGDYEETDISLGTEFDGFGFQPSLNISYFLIDNLSLGGSIAFTSFKPKGFDATNWLRLGPEVNYYLPLEDDVLVDVKGFMSFNLLKFPASDAITQLAFGGGGAIMYMVKPAVGLYGGVDLTVGLDARQGGINVGGSYFGIGIGGGIKIFL
jgi:hypothetical protein